MKKIRTIVVAALAIAVLGGCRSSKQIERPTPPVDLSASAEGQLLQMVNERAHKSMFITSKIKFKVEVGQQEISLTGNLRMKRDDVIRLQLMAFGFVEAARLEFTKDYVLIVDRINKQYLKVPYNYLDFLRNSGINFNSLQAMFWNELFVPGHSRVEGTDLAEFETDMSGEDAILSLKRDRMTYSWLTTKQDAVIKMANVRYEDRFRGNSQLNWDYSDFRPFENGSFPCKHALRLTLPKQEVKISMTLNYLGKESDWETRTQVSGKYKEVSVDDILNRFMAL